MLARSWSRRGTSSAALSGSNSVHSTLVAGLGVLSGALLRSPLGHEPEEPGAQPLRCSTLSHCSTAAGTELQCCCADVHGSGIGTGFYRNGFCSTGPQDEGRHTVCIEATEKFLAVSAAVGNPLHQAIPEYSFPGVRPGDCWCLCASRLERRDSTSRLQPRTVQAATVWPHASRLQPCITWVAGSRRCSSSRRRVPCRTPRARPCATSFRASICRHGLA